ncbi:predicted protein [Naegleria gruberi]|uniref:Predicted protein n=1 Tax=Naegleria gruberi TaxID=5762 RepID=D2UZ77_NAEGR|nr:uncharacterized protein NAEGRDRAFT_45410 [Naegleria gruberi]EFC50104.1 predicted protein [Naegleria gruberi]|eukprot:XP_002682848.1 predicted protein [Naegleria gruberi strain NEG-M]
MFKSSFNLLLLVNALILLVVTIVHNVHAQTCTSNYDIAPTLESTTCPIGFVNMMQLDSGNRTCAPYATFLNSVLGKSCTSDANCYLASLGCFNSICDYRKTRYQGDSCNSINNCADGLNCLGGYCLKFDNLKVGLGEMCGVYSATENTYSICADNRMCHSGMCVNCLMRSVNETCNTHDMQTHTHTLCGEGLTCLNGICNQVTTLKEGEVCDPMSVTSICPSGLVCRIVKAAMIDQYVCSKYAKWGEFCEGDALGCESSKIGSSGLATCYNGECSRVNFNTHEKMCSSDSHCYSGTCGSKNGMCFKLGLANTLTCNGNGLNCPGSFQCSCNGTSSSGNGNGVCFGTCTGFVQDVSICLWNNGYSNAAHMLPGNGKYQIVDLKSSAFLKCKTQYEAAYSCLKLTSKSAQVFLGEPSLPGLDISSMVMSRPPMVIMPGGAKFNSTSLEYEYPSGPTPVVSSSSISPAKSKASNNSNMVVLSQLVVVLVVLVLNLLV